MVLDAGFSYHDDHHSDRVAMVAVAVSTVAVGNDWKKREIH